MRRGERFFRFRSRNHTCHHLRQANKRQRWAGYRANKVAQPRLRFSLSAAATDFFAPCQAVIVLVDLEAKLGLVESDLMKAFNLTPAEARLAGRILRGEAIDAASKTLGITPGTGRNRLKAIF